MTPAILNKPHQTSFALDFLVIGGSSAGLSAAYALRRVGHRVLVLEQNPDFFDVSSFPLAHSRRPADSNFLSFRNTDVVDTDYRPTCPKSSITGAWKSVSASSASNPAWYFSIVVSPRTLLPKHGYGVQISPATILVLTPDSDQSPFC